MSFKQRSRLLCDTCGAVHGEEPGFATTREARKAAKKDGWRRVKHYRQVRSILGPILLVRKKYYQDHCPVCLASPLGKTEDTESAEWKRVVR